MAKKSFTDRMQQKAVNPTLQFISAPEAAPEPQNEPQTAEKRRPGRKTSTTSSTPQRAPQAHRAQPQYDEETKSRRLQVLLTPSLYDELRERAAEERMSVNEMINTILKDYLRK